MVENLVEVEGLWKSFPGVDALRDVDFHLRTGEIHAIVGENGAGKSTFVKILTGLERPDRGVIRIRGEQVTIRDPRESERLGISAIQQELMLIPELDVAHNLMLSHPPKKGGRWLRRFGFLDRRKIYAMAGRALSLVGFDVDPRAPAKSLGASAAQLVLLARALSQDMRILVMDEPTAALTPTERDELFERIRGLRANGVGVLYISHLLDEVIELADRVTVFRDGRLVQTLAQSEAKLDTVVQLMLARTLEEMYPKEQVNIGDPVLEVRGVTRAGVLQDASFVVRSGEIVGVAGLVGAGKTELVRAVCGVDPLEGGRVLLLGVPVDMKTPRHAVEHGVALVPDDRAAQGIIAPLSVRDNLAVPILASKKTRREVSRLDQFILKSRITTIARRFIERFGIKVTGPLQPVSHLSGGNQQKVVLSKWLATRPSVIIFDEPTRGLDIGSKVEIYRAMEELARDGVAILLVSSEYVEAIRMSDRLLVMRRGAIVGELDRSEATQHRVMELATVGEPGDKGSHVGR